jgi:uncharacterized protein (TIGR02246 family)
MAGMLEDKDAIREVLATYCFHLDAGRFDEMAALFTEDGVWHTDFGRGTGRAGIAEHARSLRAGDAPRPRGVHLVTNIVIALQGDVARVQSNWMVAQNGDAGPGVSAAGGYTDEMVKQDGHWLFRHRRIDRFIAAGKF